MENLIQSVKLSKSEIQTYDKIESKLFADYLGNCLAIGYRYAKPHGSEEIIRGDEVCYACKFNIKKIKGRT